ncbi:MAG TPA: GNAT family N-acetyltransferase [Spirochaetes bacterium]|nr:GNAT family N-acetyltransferase [Spirochaetota bacterium]
MIKIREIYHDDLDLLKGLVKELQQSTQWRHDLDSINFDSMLEEMGSLPSIYSNIIAMEGRKAAGFLSMICYKTFLNRGGTALITVLIVSGKYRRKGVGSMLIEKAVEIAKQIGMDELEVGTASKPRSCKLRSVCAA